MAWKTARDLGSFLAQYLVNNNYPVLEINPVSTDRARRHTVARDKSDTMDTIVIAKTLIRERANLNPVKINKNSIALKEMAGYRQMLVRESTRIKNRLHMALFNQYRGILGHFGSLFSKLSSCFLCQVPEIL
ncbi:MAG: IS110 family transposase [Candidatus Humimicrobiaceae bacterium]